MKKLKTLKAYAVINRKKPKLNIMEIFETKDLVLTKDEMIIPIEIIAKI